MLDRWIQLRPYDRLRSTDDAEGAEMPQVRYTSCLALRRVRTAIIGGILLLVALSLLYFTEIPATLQASPPSTGDSSPSTPIVDVEVNWSDFAYIQYVTNENYLCNSLMILEALHRLGAKADRIMMYPEGWSINEDAASDAKGPSRLLVQARDLYKTKLVPIKLQSFTKGDPTWKDSYTKLLAFNQTQYKRLISLDSDATVRQPMDELFLIPSAPVAMPRAYWLDQPFLSSQLILLEPSKFEWERIQETMAREDSGFDMDILNTIYKDSCTILPHRRYDLLTAEFRGQDHHRYLGSNEAWDGPKILEEAKFVHFSDWPVPKPWLKAADSVVAEHEPKCKESGAGAQPDCTDRDIWRGLYRDFSERRQQICGRSYDKRLVSRSEELSSSARPKYEFVMAS